MSPNLPTGIVAWLACLLAVAYALDLFLRIRKSLAGDKPVQISQQPLMVTQPAQYVPRADFESAINRLEDDVVTLNNKLESNRIASDQRGERLQEQIRVVSDTLNKRIDDLPSRIISELSTLGVLRRPDDNR